MPARIIEPETTLKTLYGVLSYLPETRRNEVLSSGRDAIQKEIKKQAKRLRDREYKRNYRGIKKLSDKP